MLDVKKIKYSFVLCLALLSSFCFGYTLTYNDDVYTIPYLTYDIEVIGPDNYSLIYPTDTSGAVWGQPNYIFTCYPDNSVPSVYGAEYAQDYNGHDIYRLRNLEYTNDKYSTFSPRFFQLTVSPSGDVYILDDNLGFTASPSDFPYEISGYYPYGSLQLVEGYEFIDVLYSTIPVYEVTERSENSNDFILGDLIYSSGHGGGGNFFFSTSLTQQEINDNVVALLNSSAVLDNVPSNYTNFFVIYDEDGYLFNAFFFPDVPGSDYPYGLIYTEYDPMRYSVMFDYGLIFSAPPISYDYVWIMYNDSNSWLFGTYPMKPFNNNSLNDFDFESQPVIYSNFDFKFYRVTDGVVSDDDEFTLSYYDVTDTNNNVVTSDDVLSENKDSNSIWSMLWNIFNPQGPSNEMNEIEQSHQDIINNADYTGLNEIFEDNVSLFDVDNILWLIYADNLLFNHFAGFLALCCFFITVSRLLR